MQGHAYATPMMMYPGGGIGGMQRLQQQHGGGYVAAHAHGGYHFGRVQASGAAMRQQPASTYHQFVTAQQEHHTVRCDGLERPLFCFFVLCHYVQWR
jgi:hypothetical protein